MNQARELGRGEDGIQSPSRDVRAAAVEDPFEVVVRTNEEIPGQEIRPRPVARVEEHGHVEAERRFGGGGSGHENGQDPQRFAAKVAGLVQRELRLRDLERGAVGEREREAREWKPQAAPFDVERGLEQHPGERFVHPEDLPPVDLEVDEAPGMDPDQIGVRRRRLGAGAAVVDSLAMRFEEVLDAVDLEQPVFRHGLRFVPAGTRADDLRRSFDDLAESGQDLPHRLVRQGWKSVGGRIYPGHRRAARRLAWNAEKRLVCFWSSAIHASAEARAPSWRSIASQLARSDAAWS